MRQDKEWASTGHIKKSSKDLNVETDISENQTFQQHNGM